MYYKLNQTIYQKYIQNLNQTCTKKFLKLEFIMLDKYINNLASILNHFCDYLCMYDYQQKMEKSITSIYLTITYITHDTTDKTMQNFGNIDVGEGC